MIDANRFNYIEHELFSNFRCLIIFTAKVLLPKVQALVFAFIILKAPIEYLIHPLVIILSVLFVVIDMISILRHSLQARCIV